MKKEHIAILQMLVCGLMWSTGGLLIKLLPWNALVIAGYRSVLTGGVIALYMHMRKLRFVRTRQSYSIAAAMTAVILTFLPATKLTTAANAIVLQYTAPIYVLLFSAVFRKQRMRRGDVLTVLLTIAGIALCFFDRLGAGSLPGNALGLASGVFFGCMFYFSGGVEEETRLSGLLMAQFVIILIGTPLSFVYDTPVTAVNILYIVLLGVLQLGIPYILFSLSAKYCSPLTCSLLSVLEPLFNPIWVFLVLGEQPGAYALIGGAVVLLTITLWCVWDGRQKQVSCPAQTAEA